MGDTPRAIAHIRVDSVTMMKLGGAGNMADKTNPPQMDTRHSTLAVTMALSGEAAMMFAVAAGVTTRAKISLGCATFSLG